MRATFLGQGKLFPIAKHTADNESAVRRPLEFPLLAEVDAYRMQRDAKSISAARTLRIHLSRLRAIRRAVGRTSPRPELGTPIVSEISDIWILAPRRAAKIIDGMPVRGIDGQRSSRNHTSLVFGSQRHRSVPFGDAIAWALLRTHARLRNDRRPGIRPIKLSFCEGRLNRGFFSARPRGGPGCWNLG